MDLTNNPFEVRGDRNLCSTCLQFIGELATYCANRGYPQEGWGMNDTGLRAESRWGVAFKHLTFDDLIASAQSCCLCHVLHDDLAPLEADLRCGWLGLFPMYYSRKGYFRAGFNESLARMPDSPAHQTTKHTFRVGRWPPPVDVDPHVRYIEAYRQVSAAAPRLTPEVVGQRYEYWVKLCDTDSWGHRECLDHTGTRLQDQCELPTRVIDLGPAGSGERPRLYAAQPGEKAAYVALSHCWGGPIPASTVQGNLEARLDALLVDELPRNFCDAITVTRVLGIRYLWIDSLCIVQDSPADWAAEAARMAPLYAGASLVLSILEAASSNEGFLHPDVERIPLAPLNEEYAVQKAFTRVYEYLDECALNRRAWCMQERVLARRVLHFGRQQMFWECNSCFTSETGDYKYGGSTGHVAASFMNLRKNLATAPSSITHPEFWYKMVEEYTTRCLTVGMDKLIAVAGVATTLKRTKPTATYVAGLWREDLAAGLIWGAKYDHYDGRKVWGYSPHDECSELVEAPLVNGRRRAPSWSWASVDGAVIFWCLRSNKPNIMLESLNVVMERGEDDLNEPQPQGILEARGLLAKMVYHPPERPNVPDLGSLSHCDKQNTNVICGCLMDTERHTKRECYALLVFENSIKEKYFLILECVDGGTTFKRVGIFQIRDFDNLGGFSVTDIKII